MSDGPYPLPPGWKWVRLGEVCEVLQGRTPPKKAYSSERTSIKVIKFRDLSIEGRIVWDNNELGFIHHTDEKWQYLALGDVLVTAAAHTPEQIGKKIAIVNHIPSEYSRVAVTGELLILRVLPNILDNSWLRYWLASTEGYKQLQLQVKEKHLVVSRARNILLPLPPLSKQCRIVERVEGLLGRVREARRLREEAQRTADRLWQALLAQTFPQPSTNLPEGWKWVKLGEVAEVWDSFRKPVEKKLRIPGEIPYCGANGIIDYVSGYTHEGEFVLLAEDGGFYGPGEPSAYLMRDRFWANNHVHILRGKSGLLTNTFLLNWLIAADLRLYLTGSTRPKLTQSAMKNIPLPLPPLSEQRRIVERLEGVQGRLQAIRAAQAATAPKLQALERAILERAFRGEL